MSTSYWQIYRIRLHNENIFHFFLPTIFFLLALDDNYSESVKQKHTNNSYVWKREDDEECKVTYDEMILHEEILHMPPQFLWTKVTSEAIIYPWMSTVFYSWYAVNYFLGMILIFSDISNLNIFVCISNFWLFSTDLW